MRDSQKFEVTFCFWEIHKLIKIFYTFIDVLYVYTFLSETSSIVVSELHKSPELQSPSLYLKIKKNLKLQLQRLINVCQRKYTIS